MWHCIKIFNNIYIHNYYLHHQILPWNLKSWSGSLDIIDISYLEFILVCLNYKVLMIEISTSVSKVLWILTFRPPAPTRWLMNSGPSLCRSACCTASCSSTLNSTCINTFFIHKYWCDVKIKIVTKSSKCSSKRVYNL